MPRRQGSCGTGLRARANAGRLGRSTIEPIDIAARLHDGPLQLLAIAVQELEAPQPNAPTAQKRIKDAMRELRDLMDAPRLTVTRAELIEYLERWSAIVLAPAVQRRIHVAPSIDTASFMTCEFARELVTNAARHADPTCVDVTVRHHGEQEILIVEDDGVGIAAAWAPGFGLTAMYRRAHTAGGNVDHRPRMPSGTVATVRLPARREATP